jgi:CubicO group peptidase (beta-lactamase class C family)
MKRSIKIGIAIAVAAVAVAATWLVGKAMPVGSGYVAKYICSSVFISQRLPELVYSEDIVPINPLARFIDFSIDHAGQSVRAHAFGLFARTAIYREGCGCSLVIGTSAETMRAQKLRDPAFSANRLQHNEDLPWPQGEQDPIDPAVLGIDRAKLEQALDHAFREPQAEVKRRTRAVVVIYDGRLVAERYAQDFNKDMPLLGWSMGKSVTNALVGILVGEGRLDLYRPAPVAEWRSDQDPRSAITLDQLLRMSSGLAFAEVYAPLQDATDMLFGSYDCAAFAAAKPLGSPPDSQWYYSSGTANVLARIVRQTVERDTPYYYRFIHDRLFDKIGMYSAIVEPDASGTFVGSSYAFATPRDWARFGLLYLQDGVWQGERILPAGWVAYSTTATPAAPEGKYGALFWLNAGSAEHPEKRRWPDVPRDAYAAEGFQEQKVIVVPSRKLVLVRFGATSDRSAWDTNGFISEVIAALPATQ